MYVQTPKRPSLPAIPSNYKIVLPPISTIFKTCSDSTDKTSEVGDSACTTPSVQSSCLLNRAINSRTSLADTSKAPVADEEDKKEHKVAIAQDHQEMKPSRSPVESKSFAFISHSPTTFPSKEPNIDNAQLARRKRRRTSPHELNILNDEFQFGSTPNKSRRTEIASRLSMTEKAVQIWFQNKRQSLRKQNNYEKEVTVFPPTPSVNSLISSTPMKPLLNKAKSFASPSQVQKEPSPLRHRTRSIPLLSQLQNLLTTPVASKVERELITPNSSFVSDEANSSYDNSGLVLSETRKKQPGFLNSNSSSTMTFKLAPVARSPSLSKAKRGSSASLNDMDYQKRVSSLVNSSERKPLGDITQTYQRTTIEKESIENLISLRNGQWK